MGGKDGDKKRNIGTEMIDDRLRELRGHPHQPGDGPEDLSSKMLK